MPQPGQGSTKASHPTNPGILTSLANPSRVENNQPLIETTQVFQKDSVHNNSLSTPEHLNNTENSGNRHP